MPPFADGSVVINHDHAQFKFNLPKLQGVCTTQIYILIHRW